VCGCLAAKAASPCVRARFTAYRLPVCHTTAPQQLQCAFMWRYISVELYLFYLLSMFGNLGGGPSLPLFVPSHPPPLLSFLPVHPMYFQVPFCPFRTFPVVSSIFVDRRTLPRSLFHIPTLVSAIGHFQLLDHGCGTAFRPTYDSLTLPYSSSTGR